MCQGADWEKVVDIDTEALLKCAEEKCPLFHKPLEELKIPILFMGSKEDESCFRISFSKRRTPLSLFQRRRSRNADKKIYKPTYNLGNSGDIPLQPLF